MKLESMNWITTTIWFVGFYIILNGILRKLDTIIRLMKEERRREVDKRQNRLPGIRKGADDNPHIQTAPKPTSDKVQEGCRYCEWIDITRAHEDGPLNYCRACGRKLAQSE